MNILIVDNSILFHKMLEEVFAGPDMIPILCETAKQGLERIESTPFDFICLAMHLEDNDGISLAKEIRRSDQHKHTPIILFTSDSSRELYTDALAAGVTEVFHKKDLNQLSTFIHRFTIQQQPLSGRVLYIEDTLSQQQFITKVFTERGLSVDAFDNAEEAWDAYLQKDYDIIVTDIVLKGGMSGMAFTNRIRRIDGIKGDIPILAITGFDDISRRIELFYIGVSDYVIKPLIEEELIARIRNLIKANNTEQ